MYLVYRHLHVCVCCKCGKPSQLTFTADTASQVMRRLIHTWLHPDSKGSVHLTCITTPLKWKSPSREGRIQFNHTLWKTMSMSLALQIRSTSRCRTYFISWENTASGNEISISHFSAKISTCSESSHIRYPHNFSDLYEHVYSSGHKIYSFSPRLLMMAQGWMIHVPLTWGGPG